MPLLRESRNAKTHMTMSEARSFPAEQAAFVDDQNAILNEDAETLLGIVQLLLEAVYVDDVHVERLVVHLQQSHQTFSSRL